mgnify:CR=1 FL=1
MKIYLLTRNANLYSSRRILEVARYRGHEIRAIDYMNCHFILEKGNAKIIYNNEELEKPDWIIPRIGATYTNYGATVIRQFEVMGVKTAVGSEALINSRNKFQCLQLLSMSGVRMPKTGFSSGSNSAKQLIDYVGGAPIIIKLLEGTHGLGVLLQETEDAAKSVLDAFAQLGARVMVQEFIKESAGVDIRAIVAGGKVVAAMKRTAQEGEFRSNIHRGGVGEKVVLTPEQEDTAIRSANVIGLGIAGVDMLISDKGALVIEVNSSPGIEGIEGYTQLDVAKEFIKFIEEDINKK